MKASDIVHHPKCPSFVWADDPSRCIVCEAILAAEAEAREECAKIAEGWRKECTCGPVGVGIGELHQLTCGLPNAAEIAAAIRARGTVLGFGTAALDEIYWYWYAKSIALNETLAGLERWSQGIATAKIDSHAPKEESR